MTTCSLSLKEVSDSHLGKYEKLSNEFQMHDGGVIDVPSKP